MHPRLLLAAGLGMAVAEAADPAEGWMAYAVGQIPAGVQRITKLEMTWVVSGGTEDPPLGSAFYSPWFGMDPADNLNLIQPVNPWSGSSWSMYTEYFQWSPEDNRNSQQVMVKAGQTLHGSLNYLPLIDAYNLTQRVVETGAISSQIVKCQNGKKYTSMAPASRWRALPQSFARGLSAFRCCSSVCRVREGLPVQDVPARGKSYLYRHCSRV